MEEKYKKMIQNADLMKTQLFEKFYYKCQKKILTNYSFLLKFNKDKSDPQKIQKSVLRDKHQLKILILTVNYL